MAKAINKTVQQGLDILRHASYCKQKCGVEKCGKMKSLLLHLSECFLKDTAECKICREMMALIVQHSRKCFHPMCKIQFCVKIKEAIKKNRTEQLRNGSQAPVINMASRNIRESMSASAFEINFNDIPLPEPSRINCAPFVQATSNNEGPWDGISERLEKGAQKFYSKQFDALRRRNSINFNPTAKKTKRFYGKGSD